MDLIEIIETIINDFYDGWHGKKINKDNYKCFKQLNFKTLIKLLSNDNITEKQRQFISELNISTLNKLLILSDTVFIIDDYFIYPHELSIKYKSLTDILNSIEESNKFKSVQNPCSILNKGIYHEGRYYKY